MSKRNISFIVSESKAITAFVNNQSYSIASDHRYYNEVKQAIIEDNVEDFLKFANISASVQNFSQGKVEVKDGQVFYSGQVLHNAVTERILNLLQEGFPFEPMCRFLENVMENPSSRAVAELYNFLMHQNLPITEDGCFLAYKRVDNDWLDFHSRTFDNHVGCKPKVARNQVDDDFRHGCSYGLHVGSIAYVKDFNGGTGHVIIVKVNPKDVVSVPEDCDCQKCRVTTYEVVGEYTADLTKALYTEKGVESNPSNWSDDNYEDEDDYEDDYDDEEDDDEDDDEDDEDDENDENDWLNDDDDEDDCGESGCGRCGC